MIRTRSVARGKGAGGPHIRLKSMLNSTFLVLLRPVFAAKMETARPNGIGKQKLGRTRRYLDQNSGVLLFLSPKVGEDLSFFFEDHLISAGKTV